jgi:hypothetical protein
MISAVPQSIPCVTAEPRRKRVNSPILSRSRCGQKAQSPANEKWRKTAVGIGVATRSHDVRGKVPILFEEERWVRRARVYVGARACADAQPNACEIEPNVQAAVQ